MEKSNCGDRRWFGRPRCHREERGQSHCVCANYTRACRVIQTLSCDPNTQVRAGQLCAKVDARPYQIIVDQRGGPASLEKPRLASKRPKRILAQATETFENQQALAKHPSRKTMQSRARPLKGRRHKQSTTRQVWATPASSCFVCVCALSKALRALVSRFPGWMLRTGFLTVKSFLRLAQDRLWPFRVPPPLLADRLCCDRRPFDRGADRFSRRSGRP